MLFRIAHNIRSNAYLRYKFWNKLGLKRKKNNKDVYL